jgi:hypothetical protein
MIARWRGAPWRQPQASAEITAEAKDVVEEHVREEEGFARLQAKMNVSVLAPIPFRMTISDELADMAHHERPCRIGVDEPRGSVAGCHGAALLRAPPLCVPCNWKKHRLKRSLRRSVSEPYR